MVPFSLFDNFYTIAAASGYSLEDNVTHDTINIELAPGKVYDFPKIHNCCNCGAPVKGHRCEYCGTQY